jgi:hypothetical protein
MAPSRHSTISRSGAWRTPLVRAVVAELAQRVVDEMAGKEVGLE